MKISKILTAAGLTVAIGGFGPSVFAQAGGGAGGVAGGGAAAGAPAVAGSGANITHQVPSEGQPGTQSAAPGGSASSDYMSNEGANGPENSSMSGPSAQNEETRTRWLETKVERDIVAARADGVNVAKAQHQKWLGSAALSKGDRAGATRHFQRAERDLRAEGFRMSRNSM